MKLKIEKYCLLTILITSIGLGELMTVHAQNLKEDFVRVNQVYEKNKQLFFQTEYRAFKSTEEDKPLHIEIGMFYRNNDLNYQKIGAIESIKTKDYYLMVDHEESRMAILNSVSFKNEVQTPLEMLQEANLLDYCEVIAFQKEEEGQTSYLIKPSISEYESIKIILNSKTFFIEKLILFYKNEQDLEDDGLLAKPRLEIIFKDINTNPDFPTEIFTYNNFLTRERGKLSCKSQYSHYTLENHLNNSN